MQLRITVVAPRVGREPVDVVVTAPPGARLQEVADALRRAVRTPFGRLYCSDTPLPDDAVLGQPPLVEGALVSIDAPGPARSAAAVPQLHVVSGPDAGGVHLLAGGEATVGRGSRADIRLEDPDVSRLHAAVTVHPPRPADPDEAPGPEQASCSVRDLASTNGSLLVDGLTTEPVGADPKVFADGALLRLGESFVSMAPAGEQRTGVRRTVPDGAGRLRLEPTTATLPEPEPVTVQVESEPALRRVLGSLRREQRDETELPAQARAAVAAEVRLRRQLDPDPAQLLLAALEPGEQLWRRSPADPLRVRLGLATQASRVTVERATGSGRGGAASSELPAPYVPFTTELTSDNGLALVGPVHRTSGLARWVVAQLTGYYPPGQLRLAVALAGGATEDWWWTRWLPHLTGPGGTPRLGLGIDAALAVLAGLDEPDPTPLVLVTDLVNQAAAASWLDGSRPDCRLLLLTSEPTDLAGVGVHAVVTGEVGTCLQVLAATGERPERRPGEDSTTSRPPVATAAGPAERPVGPATHAAGVAVLTAGRLAAAAPGPSEAVVTSGAPSGPSEPSESARRDTPRRVVRVDAHRRAPLVPTEPDQAVAGELLAEMSMEAVSAVWAERYARALAPLLPADRQPARASTPARLIEVLRLDTGGEERMGDRVAALWRGGRRNMVAVLGVTGDGPFPVDLRGDGPHAMLVGPAAEALLRTVLASLVATNLPGELGLVLFGMAPLRPAPHALATGEDQVAWLRLEMERRAGCFKEAGLDDYGAYRAAGYPMSRLVVAVADLTGAVAADPRLGELAADLASDGRRLGVHVVCALDRWPGPTATPVHRTVATLRDLAGLRVVAGPAGPEEARELLGVERTSDPAPDRAYARCGPGPVVTFRYAGVDSREPVGPASATVTAADWLGGAVDEGLDDLARLVAAVSSAAGLE